VDPHTLDQMAGVLKTILDNQKVLNKEKHSLGDGLSKKLAPLDGMEKWMTDVENTQMNLVKQQEKTRRLLMAIFLHGDRTALGLPHGLGFKVLGINIVPEEANDRR